MREENEKREGGGKGRERGVGRKGMRRREREEEKRSKRMERREKKKGR